MDGGDVQGQYYLRRENIIDVIGGSSPTASSPRHRARHGDIPESLLDANFAWVLNWRAPRDADDGERRARKRARVDATGEAILGLPEVAGDRRPGEECAICLKDFGAEETLRAMPCSHAFHKRCISLWIHRNPSCPLCRRRLSSPADDANEKDDEEDGEDEEVWEDGEDEEDREHEEVWEEGEHEEEREDEEDEMEDLEWEDGGVIVDESS